MAIISINNLSRLREKFKDKKIVFCSGSFDLTHAGHILFFEDCKSLGDILVVMVGSDAVIKKNKGDKRPILNEHIRMKTIDSFKQIDYCFLDNLSHECKHPLDLFKKVFESLKPDFYAVNQDGSDITYREKLAEEYNIQIKILGRTCPNEFDNISTTKLIEKIRSL